MATKLIKHGTEAGYKAERGTGHFCDRCRAAHRVYNRQFSKTAKAKGIKYSVHQVIDHLDMPGPQLSQSRVTIGQHSPRPSEYPAESEGRPMPGLGDSASHESAEPESGPTLTDRVGEGLRRLVGNKNNDEYISEDPPDYLHPINPDPEPDYDAPGPEGDEFVINKAGMVLIEDNLGTYLSVVGITLEMIDPYCGPILAENFDNIIGRWSQVIARYPRAAKLFMSKDGGTLFTWIGALQATWPVLLAIYQHHLARTVQTDKEGRIFTVTTPSANGHVDATTPPFHFTVD